MAVAKIIIGGLLGAAAGGWAGERIAERQDDGWALIIPLVLVGNLVGAAIGGGIGALL